MAYTLLNKGVVHPPRGPRYIHRRAVLNPIGGAGSSVATATVPTPCAARLIAYEIDYTSQAATTDILFKADTTAGVTIKTILNVNTDISLKPLGTTAIKSDAAVTSAVDAFSGGFPVRSGVFIDVAQADDSSAGNKSIVVDLYFRLCSHVQLEMVAQSGVDGSAVATKFLPLNRCGSLAAVALDYQNMPATTDLIIKADSTSGLQLFINHATGSNTDLAPTLVGRAGEDEGVAVTAATDGTEGANMFKTGLFFDMAQADAFTSGDEKIVVECWIDS
jgi:hypothetical protein